MRWDVVFRAIVTRAHASVLTLAIGTLTLQHEVQLASGLITAYATGLLKDHRCLLCARRIRIMHEG